MQSYAPIALFVYNRPEHTKRTLDALLNNKYASDSDIYIYADGPKKTGNPVKDAEIQEQVSEVRSLIYSVSGFRKVHIFTSNENKGLAASIIQGVSDLFVHADRIIVMEDDLVTHPLFLDYMNTMLKRYEDYRCIYSICGYGYPSGIISIPKSYPYSIYFTPSPGSWGWATWKRAWQNIDWELKDYSRFINDTKAARAFDRTGYQKLALLDLQMNDELDSWAIRFAYHVFRQGGYCIYPTQSFVLNIGMDGSGVHCGQTRLFDTDITHKNVINYCLPDAPFYHRRIMQQFRMMSSQSFFEKIVRKTYGFSIGFIRRVLSIAKSILKSTIITFFTVLIAPFVSRWIYFSRLKPALKPRRLPDVTNHRKLTRVLHVNTHPAPGGAAAIARGIHSAINDKKELSSTMLVGRVHQKSHITDDVQLIPNSDSRFERLMDKYSRRSGKLDYYFLSSFAILNHEFYRQADIIHLHNLHGYYFSPFVLPTLTHNKPTIWTLHDMQSLTGHCALSLDCEKWKSGCGNCPYPSLYPQINHDKTDEVWDTKKKIYDRSRVTIVCPSDWLAMIAKNGLFRDKDVRRIYNGVDEKKFFPRNKKVVRDKLHLPQDKKILMFSADAGLKNAWKGPEYIFAAYEYFSKNNDVLFLNVGVNNDDETKHSWLEVSQVHDANMMADYYAASDIVIYPSLADSFGLVVAEALACGTPVVTFATGGIPEIVEHMKNGYVAKYKDVYDFIFGIRVLLDNKTKRLQFGKAGRKRIETYFSHDRMIKEYCLLYQELFREHVEG